VIAVFGARGACFLIVLTKSEVPTGSLGVRSGSRHPCHTMYL
jgi:hypothetical protein